MSQDLFITPEAKVMVEIRKFSENNMVVYFSKLKDSLEQSLSPVTVNRCIKTLQDHGFLTLEWKQLEGEEAEKSGNRWIREIHIAEEAIELAELLDKTQKGVFEIIARSI